MQRASAQVIEMIESRCQKLGQLSDRVAAAVVVGLGRRRYEGYYESAAGSAWSLIEPDAMTRLAGHLCGDDVVDVQSFSVYGNVVRHLLAECHRHGLPVATIESTEVSPDYGPGGRAATPGNVSTASDNGCLRQLLRNADERNEAHLLAVFKRVLELRPRWTLCVVDMGAVKSLPKLEADQLLGDPLEACDGRITHMSHAQTKEGLRFGRHSALVRQMKQARPASPAASAPSPPASPTSDMGWL